MGLRVQSIVGCFPEFVFPVFRSSGACGAAKAIYKQFFFATWSYAAGFNNNNNNNNTFTSNNLPRIRFGIIIIYHDFLPTPRRGSHVKSDKTHT